MKIRWNPRISREKIWRLYQSEVSGALDSELLDDLGISLLLRCESILLVTSSSVVCPQCSQSFPLLKTGKFHDPEELHSCPSCSWETTWKAYHESWSKSRLFGGKAVTAFRDFVEAYPHAASNGEKMVRIDTLLHAFHWDTQANAPNRLAANNLVEGNHAQVLELLDRLSGVMPTKPEWQDTVAAMKKRRKGG